MTNDEAHEHNAEMLRSFESSTKGEQMPRCAAILGASEANGRIVLHLSLSPHLPSQTLVQTLRSIADNLEEEITSDGSTTDRTSEKGTIPS
jgi:hypothetical protein